MVWYGAACAAWCTVCGIACHLHTTPSLHVSQSPVVLLMCVCVRVHTAADTCAAQRRCSRPSILAQGLNSVTHGFNVQRQQQERSMSGVGGCCCHVNFDSHTPNWPLSSSMHATGRREWHLWSCWSSPSVKQTRVPYNNDTQVFDLFTTISGLVTRHCSPSIVLLQY
jgi:hypothetical protein